MSSITDSALSKDDWADGLGWSDFQESLFEGIASNDNLLNDELLQQAFDIGWFNQDVDSGYREAAREFVVEWLDEQGIDFDEVFDWDAWRENYG